MDYPRIDRYGHIFSLDPSQGHANEALGIMERELEQLSEKVYNQGYKILIQSGHGFSNTHTQVNLEKLIASVLPDENDIQAIPGKVSAQLYFRKELTAQRKAGIIKELEKWKDSRNGQLPVEGVWERSALKELGLDHEDAGDLYVLLKPGYVFSASSTETAPLYSTSTFKGDHGYSPVYSESRGVLMHPDIVVDKIKPHVTDISSMVLEPYGHHDRQGLDVDHEAVFLAIIVPEYILRLF